MKIHIQKIALLVVVVCLMVLTGCRSLQTSKVERDSNGNFSGNNISTRGRGVPLKLKVPSHVEATIDETYFINQEGEVLETGKKILNVKTNVAHKEQMFFVDINRPLAGELEALTGSSGAGGFQLDAEGYLSKFGAKITDDTLADINEVLSSDSLKGLLTSATVTGDKGLTKLERTVAVRRFDITCSGWQEDMNDWIYSVIHNCSEDCNQIKSTTGDGSVGPVSNYYKIPGADGTPQNR